MHGFPVPKLPSAEPVEFCREVVIDRSAEQVYALLDWADPRNAKRQLGDVVAPVEGAAARFRLVMADLPDHAFDMSVTAAVPHSAYGFTIEISPAIGSLVSSHEEYRLEPLDEGRCRVTLLNRVTLLDGMTIERLAAEIVVMNLACHNALAKLKILAEQGAEAVRAQAGKLIV